MNRDNLSFYERTTDERAVSVVAVPIALGSDQTGGKDAPKYLYQAGLKKMLANIGRDLAVEASIAVPKPVRVERAGALKYARQIVRVAEKTSAAVDKIVSRNEVAVVLGGDHSAALGSIAGASKAIENLGLIYIDAHPDCTTDQTTISGNVHGMVTSAAVGEGNPLITALMKRVIDPKRIVYIALKDIDAAEVTFLRSHTMTCITMLDIAERGLAPAFGAIDSLVSRTNAIWVSMDMDAIDQAFAPGVGMPSDGGLTRREAISLAQYIGARVPVAGIDIVEIAPEKDVEHKTAKLSLELIARFLGREYSWYSEYMNEYRETNVTDVPLTRDKGRAA